jgi:hypothetical protein
MLFLRKTFLQILKRLTDGLGTPGAQFFELFIAILILLNLSGLKRTPRSILSPPKNLGVHPLLSVFLRIFKIRSKKRRSWQFFKLFIGFLT